MLKPHRMDYLPAVPWKREKVSDTQYNIVAAVGEVGGDSARNAPEFPNGAPEWTHHVATVDFSAATGQAAVEKTADAVARMLEAAPVFMTWLTKMAAARKHGDFLTMDSTLDQFELFMVEEFLDVQPAEQAQVKKRIAEREKTRKMTEELINVLGKMTNDNKEVKFTDVISTSEEAPAYPDIWPAADKE